MLVLFCRMLERDNTLTPKDVKDILIQTADDAGAVGKDSDFGYGIINPKSALSFEIIEEDEREDTVIEAAKWIKRYNKSKKALGKKYATDLKKMAKDLQLDEKGNKGKLAARIWETVN